MNNSIDKPFTRREAVQWSLGALGAGLVIAGGPKALALARGPARDKDADARGAFFSGNELTLVGEVAEIIIPTTDTPGARAANVHGFLDQLMAQWALPETQEECRSLLGEIEAKAKESFGLRFLQLSREQKLELISAMDAAAFQDKTTPGQIQKTHSFARFKGLVFLGYYHSEIGATRELQFQLIPGRYEPCAAVSDIGRACVGEFWEVLAYEQMLKP